MDVFNLPECYVAGYTLSYEEAKQCGFEDDDGDAKEEADLNDGILSDDSD